VGVSLSLGMVHAIGGQCSRIRITGGGIDQAYVPRVAEAVQGTVQVGIATVGAHGHCYKKKRTPQHESGKHDGGRWALSGSVCSACRDEISGLFGIPVRGF
jgi:hypothetical protein